LPFFGDSDIPFMLRELGVAVTAGSVHDFGILDLNDEVAVKDGQGGEVIIKAITLTVQTSLFPHSAIATDAAIVANDPMTGTPTNFVVIRPLGEGDGALSKLMLRNA
jgi:hypothetical protein